MKLPRVKSEIGTQIDIYPQNYKVCVDFYSSAVKSTICSILNKQEVEDLITMLEFYKQEVWGAE